MSINPYNWEAQGEVLFPNGKLMAGLMYIKVDDDYIAWDGSVTVEVTSSGSAIQDGVDPDIKATVLDFLGDTPTTVNPLAVILTDTDGEPYNAAGGGGGGAVTIADGADVVEGELADAAVVGDNTGTVSAKLRGINKILADVWDSVNNRLNVFVENATLAVTQSGSWVISAGSAIIGSVTINRTTPGTTNTVAPIAGQDGVQGGSGAVNALTQRVVLATDVALPTGTNSIGQVTANAGTNLNTSALALESGGNLANVASVAGATNGAAVITDANGTLQQYLRGIVKLAITAGGWLSSLVGLAKSPDGTDPGSVSEDADAKVIVDLNRRVFVNTEHPQWWSYHYDGSSARTDDEVKADPGDGFQIVITEICFSSGTAAAINLLLEEGSTTIFGPLYLEAVAGRGVVWRGKKHVTPSTAVTVTTSAANAQSIDIQGYVQKV